MMSLRKIVATSQIRWLHWILMAGSTAVGLLVLSLPARAASPQVPWECSNYSDAAQTRCLNGFIEQQRDHISKLEAQLQAQHDAVGQLKGQVDRQAAATAQLQQQLSQQAPPVIPAPVVPPGSYAYSYAYSYPPVGIGLYFGRSWGYPGFYGYYGRPFWGLRYYGHHGRHW